MGNSRPRSTAVALIVAALGLATLSSPATGSSPDGSSEAGGEVPVRDNPRTEGTLIVGDNELTTPSLSADTLQDLATAAKGRGMPVTDLIDSHLPSVPSARYSRRSRRKAARTFVAALAREMIRGATGSS